ncbi:MAG: metallophosphoesterase [Balneolaceae bacterium]|nr:metallophosphoesterase [Balneolaceae bacterium]
MRQNKIIAIGDIHGCVESLRAMLERLEEHKDRKIVFVGDYIDRGPDSKGVVDLLLDYRKQRDCGIFARQS